MFVFSTSKKTNSGKVKNVGLSMSQQRPLISNGCSKGLAASYVERIMSV